MAKVTKRTFSLTREQAAYIDEKVAAGGYASGSELVRESLRTMQQEEAAFESLMRDEVLPVIERYEADPSRLIPLDEAFEMLEAEIEEYEPHETPKRRRRA